VRGGIGFYLRAFCLHDHGGGFGGHFERNIYSHWQRAVHIYVLGDQSKARRGYRHPIIIQWHTVEAVGAVRIGCRGLVKSSYCVAEADRSAGNYRAGRVRNSSADRAAVDGLSKSGQGEHKDNGRESPHYYDHDAHTPGTRTKTR
jgi:hypothetical protein